MGKRERQYPVESWGEIAGSLKPDSTAVEKRQESIKRLKEQLGEKYVLHATNGVKRSCPTNKMQLCFKRSLGTTETSTE